MSSTDEPIAWEKYPKMPLSTQSWESLKHIDEWIVTEKVHRANFSATVSDTSCTFAKRSGPLPDDEDFYSFRSQQLDKMIAPKSAQLLQLVRGGAAPSALAVCIFGELCGGAFPHSEVPKISQLAPVQNGVWYSPKLEFLGFDVAVAERGAAAWRFLDFDDARKAAEAAGFLFAAPLARGSLEACLEFPVRFASTVPGRLGLPAPEGTPNWAEGVVIRSAREASPGAAGKGKGGARAVFKRKIDEFSESQYANPAWRDAKAGGGGAELAPDELVRFEMLAAITEQRLAAVTSKRGRVDVADKAACRALLDEFKADVVDALRDDGVLDASAPGLSAELGAELDDEARRLVATWLRGQPT